MDEPTRYFLLGPRPVVIFAIVDGVMDCQVFDFGTGAFYRDRSFIPRCTGPAVSHDAKQVLEITFFHHVFALRWALDLPPELKEWTQALQEFLSAFVPQPRAEWSPVVSSTVPLAGWQEASTEHGTVIPMDSAEGSYIECHVSLKWTEAALRLSRYDSKTGGADADEVAIPPNWLSAMKQLLWPVTGDWPVY